MKEIEAWVVLDELNTRYKEYPIILEEDKKLVMNVVEIVNDLLRNEYIKIHSPLERIEKLEKTIKNLSSQIRNIAY